MVYCPCAPAVNFRQFNVNRRTAGFYPLLFTRTHHPVDFGTLFISHTQQRVQRTGNNEFAEFIDVRPHGIVKHRNAVIGEQFHNTLGIHVSEQGLKGTRRNKFVITVDRAMRKFTQVIHIVQENGFLCPAADEQPVLRCHQPDIIVIDISLDELTIIPRIHLDQLAIQIPKENSAFHRKDKVAIIIQRNRLVCHVRSHGRTQQAEVRPVSTADTHTQVTAGNPLTKTVDVCIYQAITNGHIPDEVIVGNNDIHV